MPEAQQEKPAAKPEAPPLDHDAVINEITHGIFTAVEPRKSHTRFEIDGKQVCYGEKRKTYLAIVIPTKLLNGQYDDLVTEQAWHGGRAILQVVGTKASQSQARKVLTTVVKQYRVSLKEAEQAKLDNAEARKEKQKAAREEARAAKEAAKAEAEAAQAPEQTDEQLAELQKIANEEA